MDALKIQNRELSHCLTSMENTRKQYEQDAKRYRSQQYLPQFKSDLGKASATSSAGSPGIITIIAMNCRPLTR